MDNTAKKKGKFLLNYKQLNEEITPRTAFNDFVQVYFFFNLVKTTNILHAEHCTYNIYEKKNGTNFIKLGPKIFGSQNVPWGSQTFGLPP